MRGDLAGGTARPRGATLTVPVKTFLSLPRLNVPPLFPHHRSGGVAAPTRCVVPGAPPMTSSAVAVVGDVAFLSHARVQRIPTTDGWRLRPMVGGPRSARRDERPRVRN